jgi:hypothetical protein
LVVIDAINSADGSLLPLADWHAVVRRHGALLVVDDAHGLGVRGGGRGAVHEAGLASETDVVTTVTLSKVKHEIPSKNKNPIPNPNLNPIPNPNQNPISYHNSKPNPQIQ